MMHAFRESSITTYGLNPTVVRAWRWEAELDDRTCPICWAMHGTTVEGAVPFGTHPMCRCSPIPVTRTWRDVGLDPVESVDYGPTGPQAFEALGRDRQRAIMGPGRLEVYESGVSLPEMVYVTDDPQWGPTRGLKLLRELVK